MRHLFRIAFIFTTFVTLSWASNRFLNPRLINNFLVTTDRHGLLQLNFLLKCGGYSRLINLGYLVGPKGPIKASQFPDIFRTSLLANGTRQTIQLTKLIKSSNSPGLLNLRLLLVGRKCRRYINLGELLLKLFGQQRKSKWTTRNNGNRKSGGSGNDSYEPTFRSLVALVNQTVPESAIDVYNETVVTEDPSGVINLDVLFGGTKNDGILNIDKLIGNGGIVDLSGNGGLLNLGRILGSPESPGFLNLELLLGKGDFIDLGKLMTFGKKPPTVVGRVSEESNNGEGGTSSALINLIISRLLSSLQQTGGEPGIIDLNKLLVTSDPNGNVGLSALLDGPNGGIINLGQLVGENGVLNSTAFPGLQRNSNGSLSSNGTEGGLETLGAFLNNYQTPNLGLRLGDGILINLAQLLSSGGVLDLGGLLGGLTNTSGTGGGLSDRLTSIISGALNGNNPALTLDYNKVVVTSDPDGVLNLGVIIGGSDNDGIINLGRLVGKNGLLNLAAFPSWRRNPDGTVTVTSGNGGLLDLGALLGDSDGPGILNLSLLMGNWGLIDLGRLLGSRGNVSTQPVGQLLNSNTIGSTVNNLLSLVGR